MKTEVRHGFYILAVVCIAGGGAICANAAFLAGTTGLAPGATVVPGVVSFNTDAGTLLESSIVDSPLFGTSVFKNPSGALDFYYQVANTANSTMTFTLTARNFDSFATAVGFLFRFPDDIPPLAASHSSDGSTISFTFSLPPQSVSQTVIISTNATTFYQGNVTVSIGVDTLGPFQAFQPGVQSSLSNVSTRDFVQTGANVMIAGFIVRGGSQQVLIRALGPTLTQFGVTEVLQNPQITLYNALNHPIARNDNWQSTMVDGTVITGDQKTAIQNTGKAPPTANESAILATLAPGNYTAVVSGVNNTTGIGLVEVYSLGTETLSSLSNTSTRGLVQTGNNLMIGGFIVTGQSLKVAVRALGPTLTQFGVANALQDPTLELHDSQGTIIAANDNWQDSSGSDIAAIQAAGLAPPDVRESVILANRPAGNTTAVVRGTNGSVGVALVEVYNLP